MTLVLTRIDAFVREEHFYLRDDDDCYHLRIYTSKRGYEYSETNQLILNFKKSPKFRDTNQWY